MESGFVIKARDKPAHYAALDAPSSLHGEAFPPIGL